MEAAWASRTLVSYITVGHRAYILHVQGTTDHSARSVKKNVNYTIMKPINKMASHLGSVKDQ
jgi:hypothetical protein